MAEDLFTETLRLERGRETLVLAPTDDDDEDVVDDDAAADDDDDADEIAGITLAPGKKATLRVEVNEGECIKYAFVCDDGLDIGFTATLVAPDGGKSDPLVPWSRTASREGSIDFAKSSGMCTFTMDNEHSWMRSRTVRATFERSTVPTSRSDHGASAEIASPSTSGAVHATEENELRMSYLATLHAEQTQLERRVTKLRRQLEAAEAELARVRSVAAAAKASNPEAAALLERELQQGSGGGGGGGGGSGSGSDEQAWRAWRPVGAGGASQMDADVWYKRRVAVEAGEEASWRQAKNTTRSSCTR